jgi:hypothetical protein
MVVGRFDSYSQRHPSSGKATAQRRYSRHRIKIRENAKERIGPSM